MRRRGAFAVKRMPSYGNLEVYRREGHFNSAEPRNSIANDMNRRRSDRAGVRSVAKVDLYSICPNLREAFLALQPSEGALITASLSADCASRFWQMAVCCHNPPRGARIQQLAAMGAVRLLSVRSC